MDIRKECEALDKALSLIQKASEVGVLYMPTASTVVVYHDDPNAGWYEDDILEAAMSLKSEPDSMALLEKTIIEKEKEKIMKKMTVKRRLGDMRVVNQGSGNLFDAILEIELTDDELREAWSVKDSQIFSSQCALYEDEVRAKMRNDLGLDEQEALPKGLEDVVGDIAHMMHDLIFDCGCDHDWSLNDAISEVMSRNDLYLSDFEKKGV